MSQREEIRKALRAGQRLTRLKCLNRFGCFEAGARITELRQEGEPIKTEMIRDPQTGKMYAVWSISDELKLL